jgi:hypothetical protein
MIIQSFTIPSFLIVKKIPSFLGTPLYIVIIKLIYIDVAWTISNMWGIGVVIKDANGNCYSSGRLVC